MFSNVEGNDNKKGGEKMKNISTLLLALLLAGALGLSAAPAMAENHSIQDDLFDMTDRGDDV